MKCPNNEECEIEFTTEDWDRGDPSTPYFESGYSYVYDETNSNHVEGCNLTEEQIEALEKEYNDDPPQWEPYIFSESYTGD